MYSKTSPLKSIICYLDGSYLELENAGLPLTDLLVQRGYGIFDFLRVAGNKPLFIEDHMTRFFNSAETMRIQPKESKETIKNIVQNLIAKNNLGNSGIRLIMSGGDAMDGYTIQSPRLLIIEQPLAAPADSLHLMGIKLVTHHFQRQLPQVKTTDYLMAIYLQPWMKEQSADDILYCSEGFVRECPRSNFFMVKNNTILTSTSNILEGITRKNIIQVAQSNGLALEIRDIKMEELFSAEEAFITSSTKRITAVRQIDNYVLPAIKANSITYALFDLLKALEP